MKRWKAGGLRGLLLADGALVLGLWLARDRRLAVRLGGGLLGYAAALALLLTQSRSGLVAGVLVVVLWLLLSDGRVEDGLRLALVAVPALLVALLIGLLGWTNSRRPVLASARPLPA